MELMVSILEWMAYTLTALALPGTLMLAVLSLAALVYRNKVITGEASHGRIGIVVPAHNEEAQITELLAELRRQARLDQNTEIWVIADNCTDNTANVARKAEANVLERTNDQERGKGYALNYAFERLRSRKCEWLMVVDADSRISDSFIANMRKAMTTDAQALQAHYESLPADSNKGAMARLAMTGMNVVRVKGRSVLNASVGILGNGFALRQTVLDRVPYLAGSVVEDLEYHLSLVNKNIAVRYVPQAQIWGEIAPSNAGLGNQRSRWEGGRLRMVRQRVPGLLVDFVRKPGLSRLESLLDLMLLPLSLHLVLVMAAAFFAVLSGSLLTAFLGLLFLPTLAFHLWVIARQPSVTDEERQVLKSLPAYLLFKLKLLPRIFRSSSSKAQWVRTERKSANSDN